MISLIGLVLGLQLAACQLYIIGGPKFWFNSGTLQLTFYIPICRTLTVPSQDGRLQIGDHILAVNNLKCVNMSQKEAKEIVIPTLRNSTPTVSLPVWYRLSFAKRQTPYPAMYIIKTFDCLAFSKPLTLNNNQTQPLMYKVTRTNSYSILD